MSTRYAIVATLQRVNDEGYETHSFSPTFYLDSDTQGITSADHAGRVALDIFPVDFLAPDTRVTVAVSSATATAVVWRDAEGVTS